MEFVEDHRRDTRQLRVVEDHAGQNTFRDDEDACPGRGTVLHAHGIADRAAGLFAKQGGHAPGRSARGEPPRLQKHDLAGTEPGRVEQGKRRHQHGTVFAGERVGQRRQHRGDGKIR